MSALVKLRRGIVTFTKLHSTNNLLEVINLRCKCCNKPFYPALKTINDDANDGKEYWEDLCSSCIGHSGEKPSFNELILYHFDGDKDCRKLIDTVRNDLEYSEYE